MSNGDPAGRPGGVVCPSIDRCVVAPGGAAIEARGPICPQSSYADAGDIARAFEAELQEQEQERQSASKKNDQPDQSQASHGGWFDRGLGLLHAGFGVAETMAGVAFGVATAETGVGAAVGGAFALHGVDDILAGLRRAGSGKPTETFTQQIAAGAAEKLGADPKLAVAIGIGVDLAAGGGVGAAEKAGVKALEEGGKLLKGGSKVLEDGGKLTQDGRKVEESLNGVSDLEKAVADCTVLRQTGSGSILSSADEVYNDIRASITDVGSIAANTGYKSSNIQKVKNHLFMDEHLLDRYESLGIPATRARFDSDIGIAQAWKRLENGTHGPADLMLLRHETAEAWYMRNVSPGYNAAHAAAQRRFPAPGF